jgi:hypothetical protein
MSDIKKVKKQKIDEKQTNTLEVTFDDNIISHVSINEDNRHYQAILQWVEDGNTIEEAD